MSDTHSVNWGKVQRKKRTLISGTYYNVPTAQGAVAVQIEVELVYTARLGTHSGDENPGCADAWEAMEGGLRQKLEVIAERSVEILAQAAPKGASAERIAQIELFEGLEG